MSRKQSKNKTKTTIKTSMNNSKNELKAVKTPDYIEQELLQREELNLLELKVKDLMKPRIKTAREEQSLREVLERLSL